MPGECCFDSTRCGGASSVFIWEKYSEVISSRGSDRRFFSSGNNKTKCKKRLNEKCFALYKCARGGHHENLSTPVTYSKNFKNFLTVFGVEKSKTDTSRLETNSRQKKCQQNGDIHLSNLFCLFPPHLFQSVPLRRRPPAPSRAQGSPWCWSVCWRREGRGSGGRCSKTPCSRCHTWEGGGRGQKIY